jgi:hypothetical protein
LQLYITIYTYVRIAGKELQIYNVRPFIMVWTYEGVFFWGGGGQWEDVIDNTVF